MTTPGDIQGTEPSIDRLAPTKRPTAPVVMRQVWSHLLFLHWAVPVEVLRPLIPEGLEVDTFDGRAYVGLVPFAMSGVRPVGVPSVHWLSNFLEVNVRTYVHRGGRDPGVWFFSLDAANPVAVALARWSWHLPYHNARMSMVESGVGDPRTQPVITYRSSRWGSPRHPAFCDLSYTPEGRPAEVTAGTLAHFLIERYILYAQRGTKLYQGRVHHVPYPVQAAVLHHLDETLLDAAGIACPEESPLVHYARGVDVRIYPIHRVAS